MTRKTPTSFKISFLVVCEEIARKEIVSLNYNKSIGPDDINLRMMIELVDFISGPIALLMNRTMEVG